MSSPKSSPEPATRAHRSHTPVVIPSSKAPQPLDWVEDLLRSSRESARGGIRVRESHRFALVSAAVPNAASHDGAWLESASADAYHAIWETLDSLATRHAVRVWNFVPQILGPGGDGMDRYMRFNAGRYRAFERWFGGPSQFDRFLPAASAVGYAGDDLVIHVLACRERGIAVSNPRQVAPHRYSKRFGPLPPCFARATRISADDARTLLIVGGTSSVRGEESVFAGDPLAQFGETLENLAILVTTGLATADRRNPLSHFSRLRIYHVAGADSDALRARVSETFGPQTRVEWMAADLCRADLTIEIEGLAEEIQRVA